MMSAPASASARAIDFPMPLVPPVTRAVLPAREKREGSDGVVGDAIFALFQVFCSVYVRGICPGREMERAS